MWRGVPTISTRVGIARLADGVTRPIPIGADGPTIARAPLEDLADADGTRAGVDRARDFARRHLAPDRFGREWADLVESPAESAAAWIGRCKYRGSILPLSQQADGCGCGGKELTERRAGKGKIAGRVMTADCLACVACVTRGSRPSPRHATSRSRSGAGGPRASKSPAMPRAARTRGRGDRRSSTDVHRRRRGTPRSTPRQRRRAIPADRRTEGRRTPATRAERLQK